MPSYHYIGLNQEHKELPGIIEAPDEGLARKKLNELGLSVVSLTVTETSPVEAAKAKNLFEFEAFDSLGKKVVGTITADDAVKAYGRLFAEYQLDVFALFSASLNQTDKEIAKALGIVPIQKEYEKLYAKKKTSQKGAVAAETLPENKERLELMQTVDATMQRITAFLQEYGPELKMEEREVIQAYLNQLLRIKDSRNLEHIRATCGKMLDHIQKQELFINEEQKTKEATKLKVETSELLGQLKRIGLRREIHIADAVKKWTDRFGLTSKKNPEIEKLRDELRTIRTQIWQYVKILFTGKSSVLKREAWESIKILLAERKRTRLKISSLKLEEKKIQSSESFLKETSSLIGWVLSFYLAFYFISYPFTIKQFGKISIPSRFYFYASSFTKGVTIFLFLLYGALKMRDFWLQKNKIAPYLLYPITIFAFLLILINLI